MAHVFLAQRVRSIHVEKATNLLENICDKQMPLSKKKKKRHVLSTF